MKTSVYIATSLDGFIARENGELDCLPGSDGNTPEALQDEDFGFTRFFNSIDTLVMGTNTYQFVAATGQWPYTGKRVIVLSTTLTQRLEHTPGDVQIHPGPVQTLHHTLQQTGSTHLYIDGGKTIQRFLRAGLIDQLIITTVPILIGSGIPLFGPLTHDKQLIHQDSTHYTNGFVQNRYALINTPA